MPGAPSPPAPPEDVTVNARTPVLVVPPEFAETVMFVVAAGVEAPAVRVRVDVAPAGVGVTGVVEKDPVAFAGKPVTVRLTGELKPFCEMMVIVTDPDVPCVTDLDWDDREMVKLGAGVLESPPPHPERITPAISNVNSWKKCFIRKSFH